MIKNNNKINSTNSGESFENLRFHFLNNENNILLNNSNHPDVNLYNENDFDTRYFTVENLQSHLPEDNTFSVLHLNIRSMNKNFENFRHMLNILQYEFKIICITESRCNDESMSTNSNFQLPNYSVIHQMRADHAYVYGNMYIHS